MTRYLIGPKLTLKTGGNAVKLNFKWTRGLLCALLGVLSLGSTWAQTQAGFWGRLTFDTAAGEGDTRFRYGNWYGPGWWGGSELPDRVGGLPPVDALDAVAQKHDFGYQVAEELGAGNRALEAHYKALADVIAVRDALALPDDPRRWNPPARDPALARRYRERIALGFPNYQQRLNELKAYIPARIDPTHPAALDYIVEDKKPMDAKELETLMNQKVRNWNRAYAERQTQKSRQNTVGTDRSSTSSNQKPDSTSVALRCTCEDWNKDGLYGVVLNGKVLSANYGPYAKCMDYARSLSQCRSAPPVSQPEKPPTSKNVCTCEDWDRDGRYGVVLNGKTVLSPNVGAYDRCMSRARSISQCQ